MAVITLPSVTDALAAVVQSYENEFALADPAQIQRQSVLAWMRAVTAALEANSAQSVANIASDVSSAPASNEQENSQIAELQAQNAELAKEVLAGKQALEALDGILHPQEVEPAVANSTTDDAAPSSTEPPTITPSAP